jgi:hypothetical protein
VSAKLRTARLYADSNRLRVAYALRDANGRAKVLTSGLSVVLAVTGAPGSASVSCSTDASTGLGDCAHDVSTGWFSTSTTNQLSLTIEVRYSSSLVASAVCESVVLETTPTYTALSAAGMLAVMPHSPRFPGDSFTVSISAYTGSFALVAWKLQLTYATSVVSLSSYSPNSAYNTPVVSSGSGTLSVVVVGTQSGTTDAEVTGTAVSLMTVTLQVNSDATSNVTHSNVLSVLAEEFLNKGNVRFVHNAAAQVNDLQGGSQTSGQLTVKTLEVVGAFAYAATTDIVNTARLSHITVTQAIGVVQLKNRAATSLATATSSYTCQSLDTAVVGTSSCNAVVTGSETAGSSAAGVRVSLTSNSAVLDTLQMRVWYPTTTAIAAFDSTLNRITPASGSGTQEAYQSTEVMVAASFGGIGLPTMSGLDVTGVVTFQVSNSSIATMFGTVLKGVSPGTVEVAITGPLSSAVRTNVVVSSTAVTVTELQVMVVTGMSWQTTPPSTVALAGGSTAAAGERRGGTERNERVREHRRGRSR